MTCIEQVPLLSLDNCGFARLNVVLMEQIAAISGVEPDSNGVYYYTIEVRLPLRKVSALRRFSQFVQLANDICSEHGLSPGDLPNPLPRKTVVWMRASALASLRMNTLELFLNGIIGDSQLRHSPHLLQFLLLPLSFRFLARALRLDVDAYELSDTVDDDNWAGIFRALKLRVKSIVVTDTSTHIAAKKNAILVLTPCFERLRLHAQLNMCDRQQRLSQLQQLQSEMESQLQYNPPVQSSDQVRGKRVLGSRATETGHTIGVSSPDLLQLQLGTQKEQDIQVEELRQIIFRQRQMGEAIHSEVLEQNELLDSLSLDVEDADAKLGRARVRARNILGK